jgi:four helix bundle protein
MADKISTYKDLKIWQRSRVLVKEIYLLSANFSKDEKFGLTSQVRRSAISIPSNIAEGWSKKSTKDYIRFLNISLGSIAELDTQVVLAFDLRYIDEKSFNKFSNELEELGKMINGLIKSLLNKDLQIVKSNS